MTEMTDMATDLPEPLSIDPPPVRLTVQAQVAARVNFAMAQNGVGVLKALSVRNTGRDTVERLTLQLSASPAVLRARQWQIDRIAPGADIAILDLDTPLDTLLLGGLNEAEIGRIDLVLRQGETELARFSQPVDLLARDEWAGLGESWQLLAAFVSPNHAVVAAVLKQASGLLERGGHSGALDGYQSGDPGRVWMLAGAIWSALTGMGLAYAVPPASFEKTGQKVRDPDRIRSEGLATCLDSALLATAALEAAGLNAVVLFAQGHAWAGVWLSARDFGHTLEPDVMAVRKAVVAREFVPFETTLMTRRPATGFDEAVAAGKARLGEAREAEFLVALDIARARSARIRPLASHRLAEAAGLDATDVAPAALPQPIDFGQLPGDRAAEEPATPLGRVQRWQRKLLDLSLANRLLNFKETKATVPLICPDGAALEDALADGASYRLLALSDENALAGRDLLARDRLQIEQDIARDALTRGQIAVPLTGREMTVRLTELYRKAKSDAQEGGTNTLFLAAGFLRWKRNAAEPRDYRAPLLLVPVRLDRTSARSEFRLSRHEDEVRINSTLLEFLQRDFDLRFPELEGDLPRDQSGIDLPLIFDILRRKVRDVPGFEVVTTLGLSTFSFAKYLMWKDLVDRTDSLRESPLVRHLVDNPTDTFAGTGAGLPQARDVDRRIAPGDLVTPLPADSSQLAAVLAAGGGHDFVLIGPPGTGKSQTIANIIAQQLALARTVLFVAEKAAALDVVHRRLEAHGLGEACLELHSNKADRKAVLAQLGRSWDRAADVSAQDWVKVSDDLRLTRDALNGYVRALHAPGSQGFSVFQAIGRAVAGKAPFTLQFAGKDCHDQASYQRLRELAGILGRRFGIVGNSAERPSLVLVAAKQWSYQWEDGFLAAAAELRHSLLASQRCAAELAGLFGLPDPEAARPALVALADARRGQGDLRLTDGLDRAAMRAALPQARALLAQRQGIVKSLAAHYPLGDLSAIPLEALELQWRDAQTKRWPLAGMATAKVQKLLQTYASGGSADPARDIAALRKILRTDQEIAALAVARLPGFAGPDSDLGDLDRTLTGAESFKQIEAEMAAAGADPAKWRALRLGLMHVGGGEIAVRLAGLGAADLAVQTCRQAFIAAGGRTPSEMTPPDLIAALAGLPDHQAHFADWTKWQDSREIAMSHSLGNLVAALETGTVPDPEAAFEQAYMVWWLRLAMDASPVLRDFAFWSHEDAIKRFRDLDDAALRLAPREVMRRINHRLPARDGVPRNSELGALRHQMGLQKPSMPIRALIGQIPESFGKLAPCVLMSPLSVAQYLPAGQAQFDLVIFDEASQITTWDAIGAIARGRQAIVVGDPRQLPPTNFFGRTEEDGEELAEFEKDMPSILDEVTAAGIPTHYLNWHYRSRDESLIAFSNHHYYDRRLVTFPAPDAAGGAVHLHKVDGVYARGSGRTNAAEAKAIVAMIVAHLTAGLKLPEKDRQTLGVITFNAQQQGLILDLLDEERRRNPALEWFFEEARAEPLIVKNLENIQGDERDVMLFSITFGPDAAGKLAMTFGALNGEGGEKRLNVAVTRARRALHVFASISADQIDLTRTGARGVRDLKAFLDFAARGPIALMAQDKGSVGVAESPFEDAVAKALAAKGWELRPQIGVSGFRIDLGVVNPDFAGAWLAGIECDGAQYHSSATARDRDKVRQAVLEGMGWTILRIWSTDWFRNAGSVASRIDAALRAALERDRASRSAALQAEPLPAEPVATQVADERDAVNAAAPLPAVPAPSVPPAAPGLDADRFFDADYTASLQALIAAIVVAEGPIPLSLLARKIAQAHGWQRTGHRIQERVAANLGDAESHDEDGVAFLWAAGTHAPRWPFRGLADRTIRDLSRAEIATLYESGVAAIAGADDPVLELARHLGIARLSGDARGYLTGCMAWRDADHGSF